MELIDLNERWCQTDHPHAAQGEEDLWRWVCPRCKQVGQANQELLGAMSAALAHKVHCEALS